MITEVKSNIDNKDDLRTSPPAKHGQRFSCAGEGCTISEKCIRWNHVSKKSTHSRNN
jgi:hypothetical protein